MDKKTFIKTLKANLLTLSKEDGADVVADYEEHFQIGLKRKRKESEIAKALGSPKDLAKQIKAEFAIKQAEEKKSPTNMFRAVYATLGLGFFNLVLVLGPFIAFFAVIVSLFATGFSIAVSGVVVTFASFFVPLFPITISFIGAMGLFFTGIGLFCLGLLFLIGSYYIARAFSHLTVSYLKFNVKLIKGKQGDSK